MRLTPAVERALFELPVGLAALQSVLLQILDVERDLAYALRPPRLIGGSISFAGLAPRPEDNVIIVKDTQATVNYTITPPTVLDARGRPVPDAQLTYAVAADPASVVTITPDATNPLAGTAGPFTDNDDGTPATCSVTVAVSLADGTMVGSFGEQFTVTAGDPASIQGGTITFEGLQPVTAAARK